MGCECGLVHARSNALLVVWRAVDAMWGHEMTLWCRHCRRLLRSPRRVLLGSILASFFLLTLRGQDLVINEVMSSNRVTLLDEDRDTPDWIEIYNKGTSSLNLDGYGLSDSDDRHKWVFPAVIVSPGDWLLVFASGKDRREGAAHWETVIDWGDDWRYIVPTSEPDASWRAMAPSSARSSRAAR